MTALPECSSDKERSEALLAALREHFVAPDDPFSGRTFLTEVTAPRSTRRADAVWIGLYQSRGFGIDVCELKVSRSDFDREISKPAKAEAWWPHCDRFWIVAPDTDVAPPDRLPAGWGLMVPKARGRRFKVVVEPAVREPVIDFDLMARVIIRTNSSFQSELAEQRTAAREQEMALMRRHHEQLAEAGADGTALHRLQALDAFEQAAGIELATHSWRDAFEGGQAGRVFRRMLDDDEARRREARKARNHMAAIARDAAQLAASAAKIAATYKDVDDISGS